MKRFRPVLFVSMGLSLFLHLAIAGPFFFIQKWPHKEKKKFPVATLVAVRMAPKKPLISPVQKPAIKKPEPKKTAPVKPKPKPKPKLKPKPRKNIIARPQSKPKTPKKEAPPPLPAATTDKLKERAKKRDPIKPVFGLRPDSVKPNGDSSLSARVGNTLMKAQEKAFTPPEEVEAYKAIPAFELSRLPHYKKRVAPEYPESLKAAEKEGEVLVAVTIDAQGKVVVLEVKRSDNALFAKAAQAALKQCEFTPGMQNDTPVTTTIDIPIKFILDD